MKPWTVVRTCICALTVLALLALPAAASKPGPGSSTGTGRVFFPNPVAYLQNQTLTDQKDADYAALQPAYVLVTLTNLDGSGYLRGDWANLAIEADGVLLGRARVPLNVGIRASWHDDAGFVNAVAGLIAKHATACGMSPGHTQLLFWAQGDPADYARGDPAGRPVERTVDLVTERGLKPRARRSGEKDLVGVA